MNTVQSTTQPDFVSASLLGKPSAEAPAVRPANLKNDQLPAKSSWLGKLAPLVLTRHLIVLFVGVAATLAWQTYGDAVRHMIASAVFSLDQQQFSANDLNAMRQSIDRLAAGIATNQEQVMRSIADDQQRMMRSLDQLTAGQEQTTREIAKFQALDQFVLFRNPDPPLPLAPVPVPKPVLRQSQARTALTPAKNP
jgi:hypothetical protein